MASKTSNSIASYYDDKGTKHSLSGYPNRIKLIYSYKYNKDGKYTLSWEIQADSTTEDTGKKWTYYYTASIKVGSTAEKSLLSSTTDFKQGETIASGTAQVTQNTTCTLVAKSYIAQKTSANLATIKVDVAIPKMPYLKVQYYSNYATEAFDGAANAVSADSNVIVRTAYFYKSQTYASGLHNYKDKGDGTYLARTGYTATGNWGSSTSGGTLLSESAGDKTGAALATHFGKNISSDNATQKLYAQWTPKEYTITLNKNGGSGGTDKTWLLYNTRWQNSDNEAITSIGSVPTLDGYTFAGYYTDKEGGTKIINANKTFVSGKLAFTTSNKTLYAHWTLNKATIHYYANGGTAKGDYKLDSSKRALNANGDLIATTINYGSSSNVYDVGTLFSPPTGHYTPTTSTNYHSSGWRVGSAGSTTYATQDKYNANNHSKSGNATVKFYARWMPKQLKIIFNKNDGSGNKSSQTVTYGVKNQAFGKNTDGTYIWGNTGDFGTWTRAGHTLLGWSTSSTATDKSYVPYCGIIDSWIANNAKEDKPLAEINLYAVWKKLTYTNTIQHYLQRVPNEYGANNNGWLRLKDANGNPLDTTFTATYGDTVTIPSNQIKTITGHKNTGKAQSEYWDWGYKTIGTDTFKQPSKNITIQYFYNGNKLTVKYKTGKVDIGTENGVSLTSNELAGTSVFYEHSDTYGINFNINDGLMNYNTSNDIYLRKYGFRVPSGSEWKNVSNNKTCTQAGSLTTEQIAKNLGVSIDSGDATVTVEPNWQGYNLVKVYNGSTWVDAVPMIYDGSSWRETIPQVYKNDTDKWKRCGP